MSRRVPEYPEFKPTGPFSGKLLNDPEKQIELLDPEQDLRVIFVMELFGSGFSKRAVVQAFRDKYGVSIKTAHRYISIAEYRMAEELEGGRKKALASVVNHWKTIIRKALKDGDYKAAAAATAKYQELIGLAAVPPAPVHPEGTNATQPGPGEELDAEALRTLAQAIADAAAENGGLDVLPVDTPQRPED